MPGIKKLFRHTLIALLLFVFDGFTVKAQISKDSIDAICKKVIDAKGPAVGLLIIKDGKVAFKKAFGYENIESKKRATTVTQFNIAWFRKVLQRQL